MRKTEYFGLAVVLFPLMTLLLFSNQNWMFDYSGADNYQFIGHFVEFNSGSKLQKALADDYKGSRLPWIIPGHFALTTFGPVLGIYVLNLTFLGLALYSLFLTSERLFGVLPAVVTTVMLSGALYLHGSGIGNYWLYNGLAGVAYYAAAFFFLTSALFHGLSIFRLFLFGICLGLCLHVSPQYLGFAPAFFLHALYLLYRSGSKHLIKRFVYVSITTLAGVVVITGILALASFAAKGPVLFFWPLYNSFFEVMLHGAWERLYPNLLDWISSAVQLPFPILATLGSGLILVHVLASRKPWIERDRLSILIAVEFILCFGVMIYTEFVLKRYSLGNPFIATMLVVPAFFVFAALLQYATSVLDNRRWGWLLVATSMLLFIFPQIIFGYSFLTVETSKSVTLGLTGGRVDYPWIGITIAAGALLIISFVFVYFSRRLSAVLIILSFSIFSFLLSSLIGATSFPDKGPFCSQNPCVYYRDQYETVFEARQFLYEHIDAYLGAFWYTDDGHIQLDDNSCSIQTRTRLYYALLNATTMVAIDHGPTDTLNSLPQKWFSGFPYLILATTPNCLDSSITQVITRAHSLGFQITRLRPKIIRHGAIDLGLAILWVRPIHH
jgi:hypothetical protein